MEIEKLRTLIGEPESETLEYKQTLPPEITIARIIASFANTSGGWLIIGISEGKEGFQVNGVNDDIPAPYVVESSLERLEPRPEVKHGFIRIGEILVYVVEVLKSEEEVSTENRTIYYRSGKEIVPFLSMPEEVWESFEEEFGKIRSSCTNKVEQRIIDQSHKSTEAHLRLSIQYLSLITIIRRIYDYSHQFNNLDSFYKIEFFENPLIRLVFSSLTDTFENFVANLLIEIHYANPNTLKSKTQFEAEEILNCSNMTEVIRLIANKKIEGLSKSGSEELGKYFYNSIKIDLFLQEEKPKANDYFNVRNLFVHRNGFVDKMFIRKTNRDSLKVGDEFQISFEELCNAFNFFLDVSYRINEQAITKYKLSYVDISDHLGKYKVDPTDLLFT